MIVKKITAWKFMVVYKFNKFEIKDNIKYAYRYIQNSKYKNKCILRSIYLLKILNKKYYILVSSYTHTYINTKLIHFTCDDDVYEGDGGAFEHVANGSSCCF